MFLLLYIDVYTFEGEVNFSRLYELALVRKDIHLVQVPWMS